MPYKMRKQGMSRRERALGHQKGAITTVGNGEPDIREGSDGDFTLRKVAKGLILYIKRGNRWYDVNNLVAPEPLIWHPMVLENSWVAFSSDYFAPEFTKDRDGFVHLRGLIKDGSPATTDITSLPPGFRPSLIHLQATVCNNAIAYLGVFPDGDVQLNSGGSATWSSLDGIIFYVG